MITTITINDLRKVSRLLYQISMIIDQHCSNFRIFVRQKKDGSPFVVYFIVKIVNPRDFLFTLDLYDDFSSRSSPSIVKGGRKNYSSKD